MRFMSGSVLCAAVIGCLLLAGIASGASLEDDVNPGWGTATLIETDDLGDAGLPQVAVDDSGNATAVWHQRDGTRSNIWSNRYVVGTGWGTATLIETDDSRSAVNPQVAVDDSGNATAVWCQSDGIQDSIWSNRYVVGTGWGTATLIETDDSAPASGPQVAVDGSGNAIAVWQQHGLYGIGHIWSNRYVVETGWETATLIETEDWGESANPQVAVDASGNATAVWVRHNISGLSHIWSNRYVVGMGWGTATHIGTEHLAFAWPPQVAVDGSGNATAVWMQSDAFGYNIWSNRYVIGMGWGSATLIETDNSESTNSPQVAVDGSGNATAVWEQHNISGLSHIWSNRYVVGLGWGTATLIETNDSGSAINPQVAVGGSGNAVAVWCQYDGTYLNIWSNRYVVGTGWGSATLIETDNSGSAGFCPQVAVDGSGNAVAVWSQSDGIRDDIWSNRYVSDTTPVPKPEEDGKSFIESYGPALGIVIALAIVSLALFFVLKGRKGGMAPTSMEEAPAGGPEVHSEGLRS